MHNKKSKGSRLSGAYLVVVVLVVMAAYAWIDQQEQKSEIGKQKPWCVGCKR
jgi:hypothetical protein